MRIALALSGATICVTFAGVLAAREQAGQRVDDKASAALAVFDQSLAQRDRHERGPTALALAAQDASRAIGVEAALGAPRGSGRVYTYPLSRGRRLSVVVSTAPLARATRDGLFMGLGVGAGIVLVLLSLLAAGIDRTVAAPLARLADSIRRLAGGDASALLDENGPRETREAARGVNALVAAVAEQREQLAVETPADPLTGDADNAQFLEAVGVELKRAQRDSAAMSLVVIDIDGFGSINDAHGRGFGDELLQRVADALRGILRATDRLSQLGGDDFALILPGADGKLATAIAERARRAVADASTAERRIACSAGVASFPVDARDGRMLLQLASGALRWAKAGGRGQTRRYDPKTVFVPTDREERTEIEALLERERPIVPFFQPLVSLSTGRVLGYEALSRFPEPPGRGPDAWFAQASRCGLAAHLEAAALRAALSSPGRPAGTFLSLNVSPSTLSSPEVQAVLPEDMRGLVIEVTEHELAKDLDVLERELASLRERGARIAVDDAGAGYSGLQQVMRIQPDVIKLDRSLVMNLHEDAAKEALIDSFVRFARRTGASVCAEGIESLDELRLLADLDVTYGQGCVLARPAPEWGTVPPSVSDSLLRLSLRSQGDVSGRQALRESGDQRLEYVSARISKIHTVADLQHVFELIADEVGADAICVSRWMRAANAVQTLIDTSGDETGTLYDLAHYPSTAHVLNTGEAVQVLASDPGADLGELSLIKQLGYATLLMVPVVCRDERLGLLEAYATAERPWTRSEINRARIIAYQLGAVLDGLEQAQVAKMLSA
ncbi:MAG TPA: EAL domain-containing protein [Thermoleophilaceae bacterium]